MATGFANTTPFTPVTTLADLYKKTNTTVKTAIKLKTEEADWFRSYPKENIAVSGNENRIPLILLQPYGGAMIPDGGYEAAPLTPAPTHGTFVPVQMNVRYGFTGLAQAYEATQRAGMIESQTQYQALMAAAVFSRYIGLQTYGQSTGTLAQVATTGGASATQVIPLKNVYGSTLIPGTTTTAQQTYASNVIRQGNRIALIRAGTIVEFGLVTASPSASAGVGSIDVTFNSSITPTANDNIVFANAVTDSTITGTDTNNWPIGWMEILTATSVHGVSNAAGQFPLWAPGYTSTTAQRMSFQVKEAMANGIWNASATIMNRMIVSQGVRRDAIAGERGARRYDSAEMDLEGDLKGFKYLTSQLAPPGMAIGFYDQAVSKVELSDQPDDEASKSIFSLDKVQDRSAVQAKYDYFYAKIVSSRGSTGYASNLTEQ